MDFGYYYNSEFPSQLITHTVINVVLPKAELYTIKMEKKEKQKNETDTKTYTNTHTSSITLQKHEKKTRGKTRALYTH